MYFKNHNSLIYAYHPMLPARQWRLVVNMWFACLPGTQTPQRCSSRAHPRLLAGRPRPPRRSCRSSTSTDSFSSRYPCGRVSSDHHLNLNLRTTSQAPHKYTTSTRRDWGQRSLAGNPTSPSRHSLSSSCRQPARLGFNTRNILQSCSQCPSPQCRTSKS